MVRDRQKEIARLTEGKPSEILALSNLNTIDYFDTTTMSYLYLLDLSDKEKAKQEKVDKANKRKGLKDKVRKHNNS